MARWVTGIMAACVLAAPATAATASTEDQVIATVREFFDAMRANDPAGVRRVTLPGSVFTSVRPAAAGVETRVNRITLDQFAANLRPGLDEQMWKPRVSVRGDLMATLSAPYEFKLGGKTTHCGIDVFDLVVVEGQWRIASLTWTAEPDACAELKARR